MSPIYEQIIELIPKLDKEQREELRLALEKNFPSPVPASEETPQIIGVGDIVTPIKDHNSLILGREYEVEDVSGEYLEIEGGVIWLISRFRLVRKAGAKEAKAVKDFVEQVNTQPPDYVIPVSEPTTEERGESGVAQLQKYNSTVTPLSMLEQKVNDLTVIVQGMEERFEKVSVRLKAVEELLDACPTTGLNPFQRLVNLETAIIKHHEVLAKLEKTSHYDGDTVNEFRSRLDKLEKGVMPTDEKEEKLRWFGYIAEWNREHRLRPEQSEIPVVASIPHEIASDKHVPFPGYKVPRTKE